MPIDFVWQQALLRLFAGLEPGTLLDLGCATGRLMTLAEGARLSAE
ncbi:MAG: hypothetical protein HYY30_11855 [Chloroflexi bacterium]|nr:hypothetical protein [Chloroflexota bacterium]